MRTINRIIIHCSDTPSKMDIGVIEINEWHAKKQAYKPSTNGLYCGYHWVIRRDGTIEAGRLEDDIGAHCKGHNMSSIGICMVGRGEYTDEQWKTLFFMLVEKLSYFDLKPTDVLGHCELNPGKTCPMFPSMDEFRKELDLKYKF